MSSLGRGVLDNLLVLLPCGELGYSSFWRRLVDFRSPHAEDFAYLQEKRQILTNENSFLHANHYALAQLAMQVAKERDPDRKWRFLFLEHDHDFPPGFLRKHAAYTHEVVGALYVLRDLTEPLPVVYRWDEKRENVEFFNAVETNEMLMHQGLYPVDVVPLGCTSIAREVFERWPDDQPWFNTPTNPRGKVMTQDVWFSRIAQDMCDVQPMIDTSMWVKHYMKMEFDASLFVNWWNRVGAAAAVKRAEEEERKAQKKSLVLLK